MVSWLTTATTFFLTAGAILGHADAFSTFTSSRLVSEPRSSTAPTFMAATPVLNEWKILKNGSVEGKVKNHPVIEDGDRITTSPIDNPDRAKYNAIVVTKSGSKYKLGPPAIALNGKTEPAKSAPVAAKTSSSAAVLKRNTQEAVLKEAFRKISAKYALTGEVVGNSYMLAGKACKSTSGKSNIWSAYKMDDKGFPTGNPLTVKISANIESIKRESENYRKVTQGLRTGQFVKYYDYIVPAGTKAPFSRMCALVMEKGDMDLKAYLAKNGPLEGKQLREAAVASIQCLQAVHSANLVWTDLKTENFVVQTSKGLVFRGIDLESAMPHQDNPVDYSPEACPPEFADAFLNGIGPYFVLEYSYDIWSLGMMFYELSTGEAVFERIPSGQITKLLKSPDFQVDVSAVPDDKLRDLVESCLNTDPKRRPSLTQVLLHPYFLTTGFGPFSF